MPENQQNLVTIEISPETHEALARRAALAGRSIGDFLGDAYAGRREEVTSIETLIQLASSERERCFELNGRPLKLRIRALSADESAAIDKIEQGVIPPRDPKTGLPNEEDAEYRERLAAARRMKRVMAFEKGILSFKLVGDTPREKAEFLYAKLPPGVIEEIWQAIHQLTVDPVENALFT